MSKKFGLIQVHAIMALLGKQPDLVLSPACPGIRKDVMIQKLLEEAIQTDDSTLIHFVLKNCWNKALVFCDGGQTRDFLHRATRENFVNTARVFVEHGINTNARDSDGNTSLHIAAKNGNEAIINLLRDGGCNPFIENNDGKQAIDLASNETVKDLLQQYTRKSSQVKMLKNLETWKQILVEEERKSEEVKRNKLQHHPRRKTTSLQQNTTQIIIQPPSYTSSHMKRSDSGIISDYDSEKSTSNPRLSITSVTSRTANIVSTQNNLTVPGFEKVERTATTKLSKSRSFNIKKDLTNQYNNVTAALRKLSSSNRNTDAGKDSSGGSSVLRKNSPIPIDIKHTKTIENNNTEEAENIESGLRCSAEYGGPSAAKKNTKRRKINRLERMSLPILPMFSSPQSFI